MRKRVSILVLVRVFQVISGDAAVALPLQLLHAMSLAKHFNYLLQGGNYTAGFSISKLSLSCSHTQKNTHFPYEMMRLASCTHLLNNTSVQCALTSCSASFLTIPTHTHTPPFSISPFILHSIPPFPLSLPFSLSRRARGQ